MTPLLSLLICRMPSRYQMWQRLANQLWQQTEMYGHSIQVLSDDSMSTSIGGKRNKLLRDASGKYVAFIDDDDRIAPGYIKRVMEGINKDVDCCSLTGIITFDGINPKKFFHYKDCPSYYETQEAYHRYPNHLNTIRASIAKQFVFPEINHGEDTDFATQIKKSGLIKTEHKIDEVIYFYDFITNKK